jgi:hypothetical protein
MPNRPNKCFEPTGAEPTRGSNMAFGVLWLASARDRRRSTRPRRVNVLLGLFVPALVTPLELLGDDDETDSQ